MILKRSLIIAGADGDKLISTAPSVVVCNLGFYSVYVGDKSVTAVDGLEIRGGTSYSFDLGIAEPLYGIAPSGASLLLLEQQIEAKNNVPVNVDLATSLGNAITYIHTADVVTAVSQLPANPTPGRIAQLQIGTWPTIETIDLVCYQDPLSLIKYWIGDPNSLINQSDMGYMGSNSIGTDDYIDTNITGGSTGIIGWSTRSIRRASEILSAGLKLQANMTAIIGGTAVPASFTLQSYFFQHNNGDQVVFSNDGSTRDAECAALVSNADAIVRFKSTGWNDVVKKSTSTPIDAVAITKSNLWPRLYGHVSAGGSYGQEIDADLQYRWYCLAL